MTDVTFPHHHIRPAQGWVNDPNGVGFINGRWHVFFQHNPHSPRHHRVGWGHWSSSDLVSWTRHPHALMPRPCTLDAEGCWSGSLVVDNGTPTLCYTAVADHARDGVGLIARGSDDLETWTPAEAASAPRHGGPTDETRDPFPFTFNGKRYIIQGFGGVQGEAQVLVYDAEDLTDWKLLGPLLTIQDPIAREVADATIWECPNLLQVDGEWVLVLSLWRWNGTQGVLSGVRWLAGDLEATAEGPRFRPRTGGVMDEGPAFYAPQCASDGNRVLCWGWSWELGRDDAWLDAHGWAGVLTTPRVLTMHDGRLHAAPAPEYLQREAHPLADAWACEEAPCFEVLAEGDCTVECSEVDGGTDRVQLPAGARLLVDGSLIEVFSDGTPMTDRIYPRPGASWRVTGSASARALR